MISKLEGIGVPSWNPGVNRPLDATGQIHSPDNRRLRWGGNLSDRFERGKGMNNLKSSLLILPLLIFGLLGCQRVTSIHPVGYDPVPLRAEDWNGEWGLPFEKEFIRMKVVDRETGMLRITSYNSEGGAEKVEDAILRQVNGWTFASIANDGEGGGYLFARVSNTGGRIFLIWLPDYDRFRGLVEKEILPGKTDADTVKLGLLLPTHLKLITSGELGVLFSWDDPIVMIRLDR
jgi:hypothetical protein